MLQSARGALGHRATLQTLWDYCRATRSGLRDYPASPKRRGQSDLPGRQVRSPLGHSSAAVPGLRAASHRGPRRVPPLRRGCCSPRAGNLPARPPSPSAGRWGGGGVGPEAGRHPDGIRSQLSRAAAWRGQKPLSSHVTLLPEAPPPPPSRPPRTSPPRPREQLPALGARASRTPLEVLQPASLHLRRGPRQVRAPGCGARHGLAGSRRVSLKRAALAGG